MVKHRDAATLNGFLASQGRRWCQGVRVVLADASESYHSAIRSHLGGGPPMCRSFPCGPRWFASGLTEVRRGFQRIGPQGQPTRLPSRDLPKPLPPAAPRRPARPRGPNPAGEILVASAELAHGWELYQTIHRIYLAADDHGANQALGEFLDAHYTPSLPDTNPSWRPCSNGGRRSSPSTKRTGPPNGRLKGTNAKLGVLKRIAYDFVPTTS